MFKLVFNSLALLSLLIGASACQQQEKSSLQEVNLLLDWLPNPNHVPLYAGQQQKIFEKYGIRLKILKLYDPNDTLPFLKSGQANMAVYYMPHTLKAYSQDMPLKVIGTLIAQPLDGFMLKKVDGELNLDQMKDKVLANFLTVLDRKILSVLSERHKLRFKEVRQIHFDPAGALKSGLVDVVSGICWNIEQTQLEHEGFPTSIMKFSDFDIPNYHELILLGNEEFCRTNPKVVRNFQQALQESLTYCQEQPEHAFQDYVQANPDKTKETLAWEKKAWDVTKDLYTRDVRPEKNAWRSVADWLVQEQVIDSDQPLELHDLFL